MTEKMLRRHAVVFLLAVLYAGSGSAQTRKGPAPQAPQNVLRAVSVYEWTGDLAKPTAARVVPVSLYIDHHFEDAGLYLSRPMPLALEPGNIYELESAGVDKGTVTLSQATRLHSGNAVTSFDEGWFGYGAWKPVPAPKVLCRAARRERCACGQQRRRASALWQEAGCFCGDSGDYRSCNGEFCARSEPE